MLFDLDAIFWVIELYTLTRNPGNGTTLLLRWLMEMCNDGLLGGNTQVTVAGGTGRKKEAEGNEYARMDYYIKQQHCPSHGLLVVND